MGCGVFCHLRCGGVSADDFCQLGVGLDFDIVCDGYLFSCCVVYARAQFFGEKIRDVLDQRSCTENIEALQAKR